MKRIVVIVLMMAACLGNAQAQLHLKANVQNNHLWRGMEVSDGIVLLTDLSYTMANDHVTVGLWGGCNSEGSYKEFNHYLNLKAGGWAKIPRLGSESPWRKVWCKECVPKSEGLCMDAFAERWRDM